MRGQMSLIRSCYRKKELTTVIGSSVHERSIKEVCQSGNREA